MKYAVLVNGTHYLLTKDGEDYALFDDKASAEELALDYSDMNSEVIALV